MGRALLILADTNVVLWLAFDESRLSKAAKTAIEEARRTSGGLAISAISLLELATLANKGRFSIKMSLESFLLEIESRFTVLPITGRACARIAQLPARYPKDPADRIIGATALVEGLPLVTVDRAIRQSKVIQTIW